MEQDPLEMGQEQAEAWARAVHPGSIAHNRLDKYQTVG